MYHRLARLTVTLVSERSNWVSVSNPLANQLFDLNVLPVVLQLRLIDGAGTVCFTTSHSLPCRLNPKSTVHMLQPISRQASPLSIPSIRTMLPGPAACSTCQVVPVLAVAVVARWVCPLLWPRLFAYMQARRCSWRPYLAFLPPFPWRWNRLGRVTGRWWRPMRASWKNSCCARWG